MSADANNLPQQGSWTRQFRLFDSMSGVALRMLMGDRAKYFGLIFSIAFSSFLIAQQISIFSSIMGRTRSQIIDVTDADIWVMDKATQYFDEAYALNDDDLYRVREVPGVRWAVPLFKGQPRAKAADGLFRVVILMGLDDASLAGSPAPEKMLLGSVDDLRQPDSAIIDMAGYNYFFPKQPLTLGKTLEMNDHRVRIVGVANASAPFTTFPVMFTRYTQALGYVGRERDLLSFVLVKPAAGVSVDDLTKRIEQGTGLQAVSGSRFGWMTIGYYMKHTGIPVNFGLTIGIALLIGIIVSGQTFYIFTIENLKQFGALKAIGTSNGRIVRMILLQAVVVGAIGYSFGMTLTAVFFSITGTFEATRGITLLWPTMLGTGFIVIFIIALASLLSVRKVLVLEPAIVFRG